MPKLQLFKIGGGVIESPQKLNNFLRDFACLKGPKILVHGGGKKASTWAKKLDIPVQMHEGRRITDQETIEVVSAVYAGLLNKTIVAQLQAFGCNAIGISGADGNSLLAKKRPVETIDYGWVGDIEKVNTNVFKQFINADLVPVCNAITHDGNGHLLNTNADTIATEIGVALSKEYSIKLHFCFELLGVMANINEPNSLIEKITPENFKELIVNGIINDGMIPKLKNAFDAIAKGVDEVAIGSYNMINGNLPYTQITSV